jgi:hypothetical protein
MRKCGRPNEPHKNLPALLSTDKTSNVYYEYEAVVLIITLFISTLPRGEARHESHFL